jgi:hypothetical protein
MILNFFFLWKGGQLIKIYGSKIEKIRWSLLYNLEVIMIWQ